MADEPLDIAQAQALIAEQCSLLAAETTTVDHALGLVLAEQVVASGDVPSRANSAMDGFAVRSADLAQHPARLSVVEDIKAGDMPTQTLQSGQCSRIMTGAPVPAGADAVLSLIHI